MSDSCKFCTFPDSKHEALTMLYLKHQDLSNLSISEIAQKYTDTENAFREAFRQQRNNKNRHV